MSMANVNLGEILVSCGIGLATVFIGLICIIIICKITGYLCLSFIKEPEEKVSLLKNDNSSDSIIPDKQKFIAAVSTAIAEDLGTDVTGIRILSVKKL